MVSSRSPEVRVVGPLIWVCVCVCVCVCVGKQTAPERWPRAFSVYAVVDAVTIFLFILPLPTFFLIDKFLDFVYFIRRGSHEDSTNRLL